jgi:hypothetical protein
MLTIGTGYTGSCKSSYHTITTTVAHKIILGFAFDINNNKRDNFTTYCIKVINIHWKKSITCNFIILFMFSF